MMITRDGQEPEPSDAIRDEPVRREEVMIYAGRQILTMPEMTFEDRTPDGAPWYRRHFEGIERLWRPLLDELSAEAEAQRMEWIKLGVPVAKSLPDIIAIITGEILEYSCQQCGQIFIAKRIPINHPRLCSDACAKAHALSLKRAWYQNHPHKDELIERANAVRARRSAEQRKDKTCETCGAPILAERSSKKFCSDKCRVAAHRARRLETAPRLSPDAER
jgi:hypothetical protein